MNVDTPQSLNRALLRDGRYHISAYTFLRDGLELASHRRYGALDRQDPRHVTGAELCHALRDLALQRWGLLARLVLNYWGVRETRDFGEMVFLMVELGAMGAQDSDRLDHFDDVFDFDVFDRYRPEIQATRRMDGGA